MTHINCSYDEIVELSKLNPNPKNPNRHPKNQIEAIAKAIRHFGWRLPITVSNQSGFIVRGHGRLMAAKLLGLKNAPVDYQDYDSLADEELDLLADNKLPELSEIDEDMLKKIMDDIKSIDMGADFSIAGFDEQIESIQNDILLDEIAHKNEKDIKQSITITFLKKDKDKILTAIKESIKEYEGIRFYF